MILGTKIKNGDLDLVSSGTIVINSKNPTSITLTDDGDPIELIIKFDYSESKEPNSVIRNGGANITEILLTNFRDPIGVVSSIPWPIGYAFNRELLFLYQISSHFDERFDKESQIKVMNYSFYLGKEVTNG